MYAYQQYGVKPDIVTTAKALGCGVPIGAFMAREEVAKALVPGDHGTTYGGNPLACAASVKVFELFEKLNVLDNVKTVGAYLAEKLKGLVSEYGCVKEARGMGLIQGIELTVNPKDVIAKSLENGLILFSAGTNVIRFVPPLVITKADVDEMIEKLKKALDEVQ
jgi:acetylornithine/N-succinyldiaminopimelate aminotransferase